MEEKAELWAAFRVAMDESTDPTLPTTKRQQARRKVRTLGARLARMRKGKAL